MEPEDGTRGQKQGTEAEAGGAVSRLGQGSRSGSELTGAAVGGLTQVLGVLLHHVRDLHLQSSTQTSEKDVPAPEAAAGEKLIPASVGSEVRGQGSYVIKQELQ